MELKRIITILLFVCGAAFGQSAGITNVTVTYSATPTFLTTGGITNFDLTLTGNVSSSTFSSVAAGQVTFRICQDPTGSRTLVWPVNFVGFGTIDPTALKCSRQAAKYDGTNVQATGPMVTDGSSLGGIAVLGVAPSSGQVMVGTAAGIYAPKTMSGHATVDVNGVVTLDNKHNGWARDLAVFDPVTGDSGRAQFKLPFAGTITSVSCSVKAATSVTINLEKRAAATPDTAGTAALTSNLACTTSTGTTTTFTSPGVAADIPVALTITAVIGTPDTVRIHIKGTID